MKYILKFLMVIIVVLPNEAFACLVLSSVEQMKDKTELTFLGVVSRHECVNGKVLKEYKVEKIWKGDKSPFLYEPTSSCTEAKFKNDWVGERLIIFAHYEKDRKYFSSRGYLAMCDINYIDANVGVGAWFTHFWANVKFQVKYAGAYPFTSPFIVNNGAKDEIEALGKPLYEFD